MRRSWIAGGLTLVAALALVIRPAAADGPRPPCEGRSPVYPAIGAPAVVQVWRAETLPSPWRPPACLGWKVREFAALVSVAGRIDGVSDGDQLLGRLTSTSGLKLVRYWSFSRKRWRRLFDDVDTLTRPDEASKRDDLALGEIETGRNYFMWQKENNIASGMVFRGRFSHLSERRIVFAHVNVTASFILLVRAIAPGEFETVYFLDHEAGGMWRYYSLTRFGGTERKLPEGPLASLINRSVAIYRYLAGVPTDREPPAAP